MHWYQFGRSGREARDEKREALMAAVKPCRKMTKLSSGVRRQQHGTVPEPGARRGGCRDAASGGSKRTIAATTVHDAKIVRRYELADSASAGGGRWHWCWQLVGEGEGRRKNEMAWDGDCAIPVVDTDFARPVLRTGRKRFCLAVSRTLPWSPSKRDAMPDWYSIKRAPQNLKLDPARSSCCGLATAWQCFHPPSPTTEQENGSRCRRRIATRQT